MRVLIIEDDEPTRFMLQEIFESYFPDFELILLNDSCNYQAAIPTNENTIDMAIIDIYLSTCPPGNQVMRWLRKQGRFADMVAVAFTADSIIEGDQLIEDGFDVVIIKPIHDVELFVSQLKRAMGGERFIYNG